MKPCFPSYANTWKHFQASDTSPLHWILRKQEHGLYCTTKVTASMCFKGKISQKHYFPHQNACQGLWPLSFYVFSNVKFLLIRSSLKACGLLQGCFQLVTALGSLVIHTKHPEKKNVIFNQHVSTLRASKPPLKKQNFHVDTARISLVT